MPPPTEPFIQFDHQVHDCIAHDLAQPVCMVIPGQTRFGQPVFMGKVLGGLTKLEAAALQIAAAMSGPIPRELTTEEIANLAIELAQEVLLRCGDIQANHEAELIAWRAAAQRNGDDVGRGKILTP